MANLSLDRPTRDELGRPSWLHHDVWPFALRRYRHQRADAEPMEIHYTDEGAGPVLVFVHAGMWSFIWRDLIAGLAPDFRCITLDFPGAGLSGGTKTDVDLPAFPAIVNGLLDHCGVTDATLVVHDLGGVVGVLAAAARPDRFTGLVAVNTFAWAPERRALRAMLRVMGSRTATATLGTFRVVPRMTRSRMGVGRHFDRRSRRAFFGPYRHRRASRNFHRAMRSARTSTGAFEHAEAALATTLSGLEALTIFGEKNDPFGFGERWQQLYPDRSSWIVPAGNHFPMCDDPEGCADRIRQWHERATG